jgi:hypothetical protein
VLHYVRAALKMGDPALHFHLKAIGVDLGSGELRAYGGFQLRIGELGRDLGNGSPLVDGCRMLVRSPQPAGQQEGDA